MSLDKSGEIYAVGYRPVPNLDYDSPSPAQEEITRKLKYDWKSELDNMGYVVLADGFVFNVNRDDKNQPRCPYDTYEDRKERKKYNPRPTAVVVVSNNRKKNYFMIQNKYDLDKFMNWLSNLQN